MGEERGGDTAGTAVLICWPWARTGSSRIFEAQARFYASYNFQVRILLVNNVEASPVGQIAYFKWPATASVDLLQFRHPMRRLRPFSMSRWRLCGRPTQLRILAEHIASVTIPERLWRDLASERVRIIHCNHAFNAHMATNLCNRLRPHVGYRPALIMETHDVLATVLHQLRWQNTWSRRLDPLEHLMRDEIDLLAPADLLIHISETDLTYFRTKLPDHSHQFVPAVVEEPDRELRCESDERYNFDFLYVGNGHYSNGESVSWFLQNLGSLCSARGWRIAIVGTIDRLVADRYPLLYDRFKPWFVGEVDDVGPFYRQSKVVIVPSIDGTGSSIKVMECLAHGKALVAMANAFRGFPRGLSLPRELEPARDAGEFLARMELACGQHHKWGNVGRRFYDAHFAEPHYREKMAEAVKIGWQGTEALRHYAALN
jgi:polysaccharide biosynthesis protein PslH